jgi:hypothetical protein
MMDVRKRLQITLPLKMAPSVSAFGGNDMYTEASFGALVTTDYGKRYQTMMMFQMSVYYNRNCLPYDLL